MVHAGVGEQRITAAFVWGAWLLSTRAIWEFCEHIGGSMTLERKTYTAYAVAAIGATAFGIWQESVYAAVCMGCFLLLFGGLVVAVFS